MPFCKVWLGKACPVSRDLGKKNSHDQGLAVGRGLASSWSSEVATVTEAAQARRGW